MYRSGSADGLQVQMFASELFAQTVAVMYHANYRFPVLSYAALAAQNVAILAYIAKIRNSRKLFGWIVQELQFGG